MSDPEVLEVRAGTSEDHPELLTIWEQSVRATHDFLSEEDIATLLPVVRDLALPQLELWVACGGASVPVGFMGLDGQKLEALFIGPAHFRRGLGKRMLTHARRLKGPLAVDVNEQNPQAVSFYLSNGFKVTGRSPTDAQGNPFPLLHLAEEGAP